MKILKKIFLVLILIAGIFFLYLEFFYPDPGYYIVALHSDTPKQIEQAINKIKNDKKITAEQLSILKNRYYKKFKYNKDNEPEEVIKQYKKFYNEIIVILDERNKKSKH